MSHWSSQRCLAAAGAWQGAETQHGHYYWCIGQSLHHIVYGDFGQGIVIRVDHLLCYTLPLLSNKRMLGLLFITHYSLDIYIVLGRCFDYHWRIYRRVGYKVSVISRLNPWYFKDTNTMSKHICNFVNNSGLVLTTNIWLMAYIIKKYNEPLDHFRATCN